MKRDMAIAIHDALFDEDGRYLIGVVRHTHYRIGQGKQPTASRELHTNVYHTPIEHLDAIARSTSHVSVCWDTDLIAKLCEAAIPPEPGHVVVSRSWEQFVELEQAIENGMVSGVRRLVVVPYPDIFEPNDDTDPGTAAWGKWWQTHGNYASIIPPGTVGSLQDPESVRRRVEKKTFSLLRALRLDSGCDNPMSFAMVVEGFDKPPFEWNGEEEAEPWAIDCHAKGYIWDAAEYMKHRVLMAEFLLTQGLTGSRPRISAYRVADSRGMAMWRYTAEKAKYNYHLPAVNWWGRLMECSDV